MRPQGRKGASESATDGGYTGGLRLPARAGERPMAGAVPERWHRGPAPRDGLGWPEGRTWPGSDGEPASGTSRGRAGGCRSRRRSARVAGAYQAQGGAALPGPDVPGVGGCDALESKPCVCGPVVGRLRPGSVVRGPGLLGRECRRLSCEVVGLVLDGAFRCAGRWWRWTIHGAWDRRFGLSLPLRTPLRRRRPVPTPARTAPYDGPPSRCAPR